MKKFTDKELHVMLDKLKSGITYTAVRNGYGGFGFITINKSIDKNLILWQDYGQSAVKATTEQLRWLLETIYAEYDTVVESRYSEYHIGYIPIDTSYKVIDHSSSHPNVYGV